MAAVGKYLVGARYGRDIGVNRGSDSSRQRDWR